MEHLNAIQEVLEHIYYKEEIFTRNFYRIAPGLYRGELYFPLQMRAKHPAPHVSNSQIMAAVTELLYASIAYALQGNELDLPYTFEEFLADEARFYIRRFDVKFVRAFIPESAACLDILLGEFVEHAHFYELHCWLKGNARVKVQCLFPRKQC